MWALSLKLLTAASLIFPQTVLIIPRLRPQLLYNPSDLTCVIKCTLTLFAPIIIVVGKLENHPIRAKVIVQWAAIPKPTLLEFFWKYFNMI